MSETEEEAEELPNDEEEEEESEEEHWSLYNSASFISAPFFSDKSTVQADILQFHFSFGYDCRKYFNLTTPDPDTVIFGSGNFINIFDVLTKKITFRRSALGGGIGHIKANPHPDFNHVAIAENGPVPLIIIYEWPTLDIVSVLKGGSTHLYSHMDFSPDGTLLISQAGDPDYLITVWNWSRRRIVLRTKSYVNDVFRVKFSPYVPGQLTTCGISHIKFWKMAHTFTGLKLQGELGRFGKTEFSDILGVLPMPDEKVVSGCAWGNILVWDAGLIKLEVFRTLRRKCHEGPIVQISFSNGELQTVAMDGHVKIWVYDKIDQADPPDDDRVIQIEPSYDFYTPGLMLMCIRKRYPDPEDSTFFGQDGNGGIWLIDLNTKSTPKESEQLYKCHAGKVVAIAACPWGPYLASLGEDGRFYLYAYLEKQRVFDHEYPAKGASMIWCNPKICPSGDELIVGFDDGTIRLSLLIIKEEIKLQVINIIKCHTKAVTQITVNCTNQILVTGSEDSTIFFFQIVVGTYIELVPIGYIRVPNPVTCFTWHFEKENVLLVGCLHGEIVQVEAPYVPQSYTTVSYLLDLNVIENCFKTYKAQIRRDIKLKEIEDRKAEKVAKKRVQMEKLKRENPGLDIDEEVYLADSDTEEELEPLFIPEVPNRIIWMQSTEEDTIWLSLAGYDAGYIYEYQIEQKSDVPYFFQMVDDADDTEISSYIYNHNKKYLIFAMQHGEIRVNKIQDGNYKNLSDYWTISMHDNQNGFIPNMCFSYDENFFFSCGYDGNVFSYTFHPEDGVYVSLNDLDLKTRLSFPTPVEDESYYDKLSLEQASLKKEQDRIDCLAAEHREILRGKIRKLRMKYLKLLDRNNKLLPSQIIPIDELEVDIRVTQHLDKMLEDELALVKRKLAFDVQKSELRMKKLKQYFVDGLIFIPFFVTGLKTEQGVKMLRQNKIPKENEEMLNIVDEKIRLEELKGRPPGRPPPPSKQIAQYKRKEQGLEYFLVNVPLEETSRKYTKLTRLLQKYRERKLKWERREDEWEEFMARKPIPGVNHPKDEAALAEAKITIGDYKLKSDPAFKPKKGEDTTLKKYKELLLARVKQSTIRYNFNKKVYDLRDKKLEIRTELEKFQADLEKIHAEIPEDVKKEAPVVNESIEDEFPEKNFEITVELELEEGTTERKSTEIVTVPKPANLDELEWEMLPTGTKKIPSKDIDFANTEFDALCNLTDNEKTDTFWEQDLRKRRLEKKLFQQDDILRLIDRKISGFDTHLNELQTERFQVEVSAKLMDVFMITLQQEYIILKEFESIEEDLQAKVNAKISQVMDMCDIIDGINADIASSNTSVEEAHLEIKHIQTTFTQAVQDNKFAKFLGKVFKKKYKPPKIKTDDDSSSDDSSSSSSSSSEEDDTKSIDSRDFGIIKQDLNVCPKGCDPAVYDYAVKSRTQRHQHEIRIKDLIKGQEILKKNLLIQNKKVKLIEDELKISQGELEKYQKQKQERLNQVRCTLVLYQHQLQHLTPDGASTTNIAETLVFSKAKLSNLYKRVTELQKEIEQLRRRHRLNVRHYTRMTTDCGYMTKQIKSLQEEITDNMKIKFGKVVDLNEVEEAMLKRTFGKDDLHDLEEVILKKIVHDMRLDVMDIKGMYATGLKYWSEKITQTERELIYGLRYNTSQQELLSSLIKEKSELALTLASQEKKQQFLAGMEDVQKTYDVENAKLSKIIEEQCQQLQQLKNEIKMLKTKGMLPQPKEEKAEEEEKLWDHLELEEIGEEEEERKPFSTEIVIPTNLKEESRETAVTIIQEMLSYLNVCLSKKSSENFIKNILDCVMRGMSVTDLIKELLRNLPIEPDDDQMGIIETAAEQLYVVDEEADMNARDVLEDIVDEVLLTKGEPQSVIAKMVTQLVEQLPIDFLKKKDSIEYMIDKLMESNLNCELNRVDMMHMLHTEEAKNILDEIIQTVFDTGLDILYYIE